MSRQFSHEEFEAAKAAFKQSKSSSGGGLSHYASSPSAHQLQHEDMQHQQQHHDVGESSGLADEWFRKTFHQQSIPDHPSIKAELSQGQLSSTDLNGFCQGNVGPADQRYLLRQQHAAAMSVDPNVEYYQQEIQAAAAAMARRRQSDFASSDRHHRESSESSKVSMTFYVWLRLILIAFASSCLILYFSFSFLPCSDTSSLPSIVWFLQVFFTVFVSLYIALHNH